MPQVIGLAAEQFINLRIVEVFDEDALDIPGILSGCEEVQGFVVNAVNPFECLAHTDGPGQGRTFDLQLFFDLCHKIKW